jgi:hypothetical protein
LIGRIAITGNSTRVPFGDDLHASQVHHCPSLALLAAIGDQTNRVSGIGDSLDESYGVVEVG